MTSKIMTRAWPIIQAQQDKAGAMVLQGYAARYNVTANLGNFFETIQRGAFDGADFSDVRFLTNHEGIPLARSTNGSLRLRVNNEGLHYIATLPDTAAARELFEAVKDGRLTSSSFAFTIAEEEWRPANKLRIITRVGQVLDVSPVTYPAYLETSVTVAPDLGSLL
jgi:HK97 family phage prohead protease